MTACLFSLQAQESNVWTDKFALPREVKDAAKKDLVSVAIDKSVYATGLFTEGFSFGSFDLEPIATSTYLVKYDAEGNKKWAVAFAGAATPTAITVAQNGSIYVAGTLADEVIFGSTDDATQTKEGTKREDGTFYTTQRAAFIAQYNAEGVLLNVKTYIPEALKSAIESGLLYEDPVTQISVSQIQETDLGLIASFMIRGEVIDNGVMLKGSYYNIFDFMADDVEAGYIINLESDLSFSKIIASLSAPENEPFQYNVESIAFTIDNNKIYAIFEVLGSQTLNVGNSKTDFNFSNDGENFVRGYVIASIDVSTELTLISSVKYENSPQPYGMMYLTPISPDAINMVNGDLIVTGHFGNDLPFNRSLIAADGSDLYVAVLNASDLSVKSTVASAQTGAETATGTAIIGDNVFISSIIDKKSNLYSYNLKDNQTTNSAIEGYLNSIAANGDGLASITVPVDGETAELVVKLDKYDQGSGIENNWDNAINVTAYPNPVVAQLFFSESCDVYVYNNIGVLVVSKKDATSINVESLTNGVYFAVVTTPNGKQTIPFVKK